MLSEELTTGIIWHGRFMVFAWVLLIPLGVLIARFFKVLPSQPFPEELDNPFWWNSHLVLQIAAIVFTAIAITLIVMEPPHPVMHNDIHRLLGWTTVTLCGLQLLSGVLRGSKGGPGEAWRTGSTFGDHYNMTVRRRWFERFHKSIGYVAIVFSMVTVLTGLWTASAPVWMAVLIISWWIVLVVVFIYLQTQGRCVDTYQAIWGHRHDDV